MGVVSLVAVAILNLICKGAVAMRPPVAGSSMAIIIVGCSIVQISNWFANARRRLKNTVDRAVQAERCRPAATATTATTAMMDVETDGHGLDWAQRIRLYNRHTVGNQERLSISSSSSADNDSDREHLLLDDDVTGCHDDGHVAIGNCSTLELSH